MSEELLTIKQVAKFLNVSRAKVYSFINDELNPLQVVYISERNPRVKKEDLNIWIDNQKVITEERDQMRYDHIRGDTLKGGEQ